MTAETCSSGDDEVYQAAGESINEALRKASEARRARGGRRTKKGSKEEHHRPSVVTIQAEATVAADAAEWGEAIQGMDDDLQVSLSHIIAHAIDALVAHFILGVGAQTFLNK